MNVAIKPAEATRRGLCHRSRVDPANADRFQKTPSGLLERHVDRSTTADSAYGPWSVTGGTTSWRWTPTTVFSSADGIVLSTLESIIENEKIRGPRDRNAGGFISMDPPHHGPKRKAVTPVVAPDNLARMAPQVRQRAGLILDSLPIGQEFDWVDKVSKELTAMTLATLFDFPFEDRRKLTYWSDMFTNQPGHGRKSWAHKLKPPTRFSAFNDQEQRVKSGTGSDMIS